MPHIELLDPTHELAGFTSGNSELDAWLATSALHAQRMHTARVYVDVEGDRIVGYFAIAPYLVARSEVPSSIGRGSPQVIPSFLLARLAISVSNQGKGHGGELLVTAIETMLSVMKTGGGRLLVVDAIDDAAISFYSHHGFKALPDNPQRMFLKASTAAAALGFSWS
ncbi:MAG: GNAT family N-acetyltransferase [Nitriliruptoraceae bacterium]